jgi:hypothetical protein
VLFVLGEGLEAATTPVVLILELTRDHIHALVVVFEPRLLSEGERLGVRKLSVCRCLVVQRVRPQSVVSSHKLGFVLKGSCFHIPKDVKLLNAYPSGAGLKFDLVFESISTLSVPKQIWLPTYFWQL